MPRTPRDIDRSAGTDYTTDDSDWDFQFGPGAGDIMRDSGPILDHIYSYNNPAAQQTIRNLYIRYALAGDEDGFIKEMLWSGYIVPGINDQDSRDRSPGGWRGGGGGGGRSKAEQDAIDIENWKVWLNDQAETMGITFDDGAITAIATTAVTGGWSQDRAINYMVGAAENWSAVKEGTIKQNVDAIKVLANDYLLTVSDETAQSYARRIATSELTMEAIMTIFRTQAKQSYSWAAQAIDSGISVRDFVAPSRDLLAQELEINPNDIDLLDSKWLSKLQVKNDKGEVRAATNDEVIRAARQDPSFAKTRKAQDMAATLGMNLTRIFGG